MSNLPALPASIFNGFNQYIDIYWYITWDSRCGGLRLLVAELCDWWIAKVSKHIFPSWYYQELSINNLSLVQKILNTQCPCQLCFFLWLSDDSFWLQVTINTDEKWQGLSSFPTHTSDYLWKVLFIKIESISTAHITPSSYHRQNPASPQRKPWLAWHPLPPSF